MLNGKKVLLTAGPTYEPIDPVRFIGNHSTGKMGFALAECFAREGAEVTLVSGPVNLKATHPGIKTVSVTTADQMFAEVQKYAAEADIWVFAAAVADYKPKQAADLKIKKDTDSFSIELVKNVDIAATLGKQKRPDQFAVGFALETNNELAHAQQKLQKKNLNMVILNSLQDAGAGFKHDTNKITIVEPDKITNFELKAKTEVAEDIVRKIKERIYA
ncbi:bifunctional phosphopantothenoylcysteine decarboxylase/phosphopantothenate--cysteine ligase CoaBC [Adhaeribacter soli]|uniref:bifunctional phosphopantothenoylcysteine decarboxylase/phosphopantothenate--cysteine ligase CoaBC n=1 Tax=Adhaeribacter soli TaxID=2607655 RepID=UPI00178504F9|nr:bifunctional phosphopantothenoylcysteine decarboxylase/phosphopantothenate--cysteine ligase CoaBC [Adhaeribacter soli]